MDADVIVVGAGLAGAAAALKLSKAGKRVRVIEARDRCGGCLRLAGAVYFFACSRA